MPRGAPTPLPLGQCWMPLRPLACPGTLMWPPKPASRSSPGGRGAGRERHQARQPKTAHFFLYILYICMYLYMIFYYKYRAQMGPGSGGGVSCWSVPTQERGWGVDILGRIGISSPATHKSGCHPLSALSPCLGTSPVRGQSLSLGLCSERCSPRAAHPGEVLTQGCRGAHLWVLITPAQPLQPSPPAQGLGGFGGAQTQPY